MVRVKLGWVNVPTNRVKGVTGIAREICKAKGFVWTNVKDVGNATYNHTIQFMECYVQTIDGVETVMDSNAQEPTDTINDWLRNQIGYVR